MRFLFDDEAPLLIIDRTATGYRPPCTHLLFDLHS